MVAGGTKFIILFYMFISVVLDRKSHLKFVAGPFNRCFPITLFPNPLGALLWPIWAHKESRHICIPHARRENKFFVKSRGRGRGREVQGLRMAVGQWHPLSASISNPTYLIPAVV